MADTVIVAGGADDQPHELESVHARLAALESGLAGKADRDHSHESYATHEEAAAPDTSSYVTHDELRGELSGLASDIVGDLEDALDAPEEAAEAAAEHTEIGPVPGTEAPAEPERPAERRPHMLW